MTPEDGISGSWTRPLRATSKDGAFAIENVAPARYRLSASLAPESPGGTWWFASATSEATMWLMRRSNYGPVSPSTRSS